MFLPKPDSTNSQTFYNFLSTVISSGVAFITMPAFTRLLGAGQFGLYSIYTSWLAILVCIMGLNVKAGLGAGYYRFDGDYYGFRSSTLVEGSVICIIITAVLLTFNAPLRQALGYPPLPFIFLILESFAQYVLNFANLSWVYEKHAARNMSLSLATLILTTSLSIFLLLNWGGPKEHLYYARVLGAALPQISLAAFIWVFLFREKKCGYNPIYWKYSLAFGVPMVFHTLSHQVLSQSDRIMMQMYSIGDVEIGVYSFFYSFSGILSVLLSALNNSWCPFLYDDLSRKAFSVLNSKVSNYVQIFTILCCGFLMVSREFAKAFTGSEYWAGMPIIPVFVLVAYCTFFYQFAVNYELYHAKPRIVAAGTIIAALTNIVFNAILIPPYGMYGAAAATLLSYIALASMHTFIVTTWKGEKYPLSYRPVAKGALTVALFCAFYYLLSGLAAVRWAIGILLGLYLVWSVYHRKTIF